MKRGQQSRRNFIAESAPPLISYSDCSENVNVDRAHVAGKGINFCSFLCEIEIKDSRTRKTSLTNLFHFVACISTTFPPLYFYTTKTSNKLRRLVFHILLCIFCFLFCFTGACYFPFFIVCTDRK